MIRYIQEEYVVGDQITIYYNNREVCGVIDRFEEDAIFIRFDGDNILAINGAMIGGFANVPYTGHNKGRKNNRSTSHQRVGHADSNDQGWKEPQSYSAPQYVEPYKSDSELDQEVEIYKEIAQIKEQLQEELGQLIDEQIIDLDTVVPEKGSIVELKQAFQFGFIDDLEDGTRYFFNRNEIIDGDLKGSEGQAIPVVYQRTRNHKGPAAKMIFPAVSVGETLQLFQDFLDAGQYSHAKFVLDSVREVMQDDPDLSQMDEYVQQILEKSMSLGGEIKKGRNSLYTEARKRLQNKDYDSALEIYNKCLNLGIRKDNCIKDILQIYVTTFAQKQSDFEREEVKQIALNFIDQYQDELPDEPSTNFTLENAYFALCEYEKHVEIAEEIVAECGRKGELPQYVFYLNKLGQSYLRLGEFDKAMDAVQQGLDIEPQNLHLMKTMNSIMLAQRSDEYYM